MSFDPNSFQDQAAIAAMLQRQKLINSQNQPQPIPANRKCPWCGGCLSGQYPKCSNCASDISWVGDKPFQPGSYAYRRELKELEKSIGRKIKPEDRQIVACESCHDMREKRLMYNDGLCARCHYSLEIQRKKEGRERPIKIDRPILIFFLVLGTALLVLLIAFYN
jgi:hypothetical protein